MPHALVFTFDAAHGLTLVAGESVVTDLTGVTITQRPNGQFDCSVSRASGGPVRLVAADSAEGRGVVELATGQQCSAIPGFVGVAIPSVVKPPPTTLAEEIARAFGWSPDTLA